MGPFFGWALSDPLEVAASQERIKAMLRRIKFRAAHPDFKFFGPWETTGSDWVMFPPGDDALSYPDVVAMMDDLEKRYPA